MEATESIKVEKHPPVLFELGRHTGWVRKLPNFSRLTKNQRKRLRKKMRRLV